VAEEDVREKFELWNLISYAKITLLELLFMLPEYIYSTGLRLVNYNVKMFVVRATGHSLVLYSLIGQNLRNLRSFKIEATIYFSSNMAIFSTPSSGACNINLFTVVIYVKLQKASVFSLLNISPLVK